VKRKIAILLIIVTALAAIYRILVFIEIDRCLDSGGKWNYDESICLANTG